MGALAPIALVTLAICWKYANAGGNDDRNAARLVRAVVAGIRSNYSPMRTIVLQMEEVHEDTSVSKVERRTVKLPRGGIFSYTLSPRSSSWSTVYIRGQQLRRDSGVTSKGRSGILLYKDGVWTQYAPDSHTAWVRRTDQMPGMFPVDPRNAGSPDLRCSVLDILEQDDIVSAEFRPDRGAGGIVEIVTTGWCGRQQEQELRFAPRYGFLPVSRITRHEDGTVCAFQRVAYQSVLDGRAWFLKEEILYFFDPGVTRTPQDDGWRQKWTRRVTHVAINEDIPERTFSMDLPAGTRIRNSAAWPRQRPRARPPAVAGSALLLTGICAALVALVLLGWALRRWYRT